MEVDSLPTGDAVEVLARLTLLIVAAPFFFRQEHPNRPSSPFQWIGSLPEDPGGPEKDRRP